MVSKFELTEAEASIVPAPDRVAIRETPAETMSKGGIHVPDAFQEPQASGNIVALGETVKSYRIGDLVYFGKYAGTRSKVAENEELVFIRADDLIYKKKTAPAAMSKGDADKARTENHLH